jgi:hypothetical protein
MDEYSECFDATTIHRSKRHQYDSPCKCYTASTRCQPLDQLQYAGICDCDTTARDQRVSHDDGKHARYPSHE